MKIGCENHAIKEWHDFDCETIEKMSRVALYFWKTWKPALILIFKSEGKL